jgi:hypothetical protein
MANEEHLKILKQGVEIWNRQREENPEVAPDLNGADLRGVNLCRANLRWAHLGGADLQDARLEETNLTKADLSGANLLMANLRRADLSEANLTEAGLGLAKATEANLRNAMLSSTSLLASNLNGAELMGAKLYNTDFTNATLKGADLHQAVAQMAQFISVDLSEAKGLESMVHQGHSVIDISTVFRSKGKIPETFLRGCGVPDEFITYMKSLVGRAIEFYSCFISYSSKDQEFADCLYTNLQNSGVRCWLASEDMKIGDDIWDTIDQAIRDREKLLLIFSKNSIKSAWVENEVKKALAEERREAKRILFPIRIDDSVMECDKPWATLVRDNRHIGDFKKWKQPEALKKSFERLLRDLRTADH